MRINCINNYIKATLFISFCIYSKNYIAKSLPNGVRTFKYVLNHDGYPSIKILDNGGIQANFIFSDKHLNSTRFRVNTKSSIVIKSKHNPNGKGTYVAGMRVRTATANSDQYIEISTKPKTGRNKTITIKNENNNIVMTTKKLTSNNDVIVKKSVLDFGDSSRNPQITVTRYSNNFNDSSTKVFDGISLRLIQQIDKKITPGYSIESSGETNHVKSKLVKYHNGSQVLETNYKKSNITTKTIVSPDKSLYLEEHDFNTNINQTRYFNKEGTLKNLSIITPTLSKNVVFDDDGKILSSYSISKSSDGDLEMLETAGQTSILTHNSNGDLVAKSTLTNAGSSNTTFYIDESILSQLD